MTKTIGIIGLGRVGLPAAKAYLAAGYTVYGCNKSPEVLEELKASGGHPLSSPEEVARMTDTILVIVLNDQQVKEVVTGEKGLLKSIRPGGTIIGMSTINRSSVEEVARQCVELKVGYVDCPFTGGPARVPTGSLTLIVAAAPELIDAVTPTLRVIGNIVYAGAQPGLGQAIKHCNQLLVGATHAATMEVIVMAKRLGLDPSLVSLVIAGGIAGSDYFRLLSDSVLNGKPSPGGLGQMGKDISIVVNTTEALNMDAAVAKAVAKYFKAAEEMGLNDREGAALIEAVEKISGKQ